MKVNSHIQNVNVLLKRMSQYLLGEESAPVRVQLLEQLSAEEGGWIFLTVCEDEQVKKGIEEYLLSEEKGNAEYGECGKEYIVHADVTKKITDSRYDRRVDKEVKTAWLFIADKKKYTYKILASVFMCALLDRVTDLLQVERIIEKVMLWGEDISQDKLIGHYCGKLFNKEWLLNEFVSDALEKRKLPKSEKFLQLSAMRYETRASETGLYFGDQSKVELKLKFDQKIINREVLDFRSEDCRIMRKLMELAGKGYGLMIDVTDDKVMTVCGVLDANDSGVPECYVKIEGYLHWGLYVEEEKVFEYSNGTYSLKSTKEESEIEEKFNKLKKFLLEKKWTKTEDKAKEIIECLKEIKKMASHGTSVVFLGEGLEDKVKELTEHNRAYKVMEEKLLDLMKISGFTAIDGAIVADFDCKCIGIGVILDGKSLLPGNAGRGARYNSVTNYVRVIAEENPDAQCFAAIFSEDKTVDFACVDKVNEKKICLI